MKRSGNLNLNVFEQTQIPSYTFNDELAVLKIEGEHKDAFGFDEDTPIRLDKLCMLLVCKGEIRIKLDYVTHQITSNTLLNISQHLISGISISGDFVGYQLVMSRNMIEDILRKERPIPLGMILSRHTLPYVPVNEDEMALLSGLILRVINDIQRSEHIFQRNLIVNELSVLLIEIGHILLRKQKDREISIELGRKEEIIRQFFKLLNKHCKEEHEVSFYAKELCMTPEYLSRVLKKATRSTAGKWIANALLTEAKILLRDSNLNIQQVTDILNFSDQSSFGKFFKKHRGISPLVYRKRLMEGDN